MRRAAADIRSVRERHFACCQRSRGASRRAARSRLQVPGIARVAEDPVRRHRHHAHFRRTGLGDDDAAARLQPGHERVGLGRDIVGIERATVGRTHAFDVDQVLDGDGQARQQPPVAGRNVLKPLRIFAGAVENGAAAAHSRPRPRPRSGLSKRPQAPAATLRPPSAGPTASSADSSQSSAMVLSPRNAVTIARKGEQGTWQAGARMPGS